jgi:hypothetical protein
MRLNRLLNRKRLAYGWISGAALWLTWFISLLFGEGNLDLAGNVVGTDFIQFYSAGLTVRTGQEARLFDFRYQQQIERSIAAFPPNAMHAFITPPFLAWLYAPFSLLPYTWSFIVWSLLSLAALWGSLRWLGAEEPIKWFAWSLTWYPVFASIGFGQNSLLSLSLLSLAYFLWRSKRPWLAGMVCSLALYKPQLLLGVALIWLLSWRRDWKALVGLALGGGLLAGLSFWFIPEASQDYLVLSRLLFPRLLRFEGFPIWHTHTLRAFWLLLFPGAHVSAELFWIGISLLGIFFFIRFWQSYKDHQGLVYAGAICLTILVTPHALIYDWAILLIPAVLLWKHEPGLRHFWKPIFALMWVASIASGSVSLIAYKATSHAFQISVPVFLYVLFCCYTIIVKSPSVDLSAAADPGTGEFTPL